jgi:hypothetical protein
MSKWLLAAVLVVGAHFSASYLVPLDAKAQQTFAGLLKWFWPWSDGDSGPLGVMTVASGFPLSGFLIAVASAGFFFLAALAIFGKWIPFGAWRWLSISGAALSVFLMAMFFSPTKLIPIVLDLFVLWAGWTNLAVAR